MSEMMMGGQPGMGQPSGDEFETELEALLTHAREIAQLADDPQEALSIEKITTLIQQIIAQRDKADQDLMQGKANPAALVKALSGLGG